MSAYPPALQRVRALPLRPAIDAVVASRWDGATVVGTTAIAGGLGSAVDRVRVRHADGDQRRYVLRRQVPEWDGDVALERDVLDALLEHGAPVPAARWHDASGEVFGVPAILIDHVPGELVGVIRSPERVARMGRALATVHAVPRTAWPGSLAVPEVPFSVRLRRARGERLASERVVDAFVDAATLWDALEEGAHVVDDEPLVLVHDDFHPGNVLDDGSRSTIIDWGYPAVSHAGLDLGYATMDLTLTGDEHLCQPLLDGYAEVAGRTPEHLWLWQLVAVERSLPSPSAWLPGYRDQGHPELTRTELEERGRRFLAAALAQGRSAGVLATLTYRDATLERDA